MKSPKDTSWTKHVLLISVARGVAQRETPNPHPGGHKVFGGPGLQMHVFRIPVLTPEMTVLVPCSLSLLQNVHKEYDAVSTNECNVPLMFLGAPRVWRTTEGVPHTEKMWTLASQKVRSLNGL